MSKILSWEATDATNDECVVVGRWWIAWVSTGKFRMKVVLLASRPVTQALLRKPQREMDLEDEVFGKWIVIFQILTPD